MNSPDAYFEPTISNQINQSSTANISTTMTNNQTTFEPSLHRLGSKKILNK